MGGVPRDVGGVPGEPRGPNVKRNPRMPAFPPAEFFLPTVLRKKGSAKKKKFFERFGSAPRTLFFFGPHIL